MCLLSRFFGKIRFCINSFAYCHISKSCRRPNPLIRFCTKRLIQYRWGLHVRSFLVSQTRIELPTSCERCAFPAWASHIRVLRNVYINIKHLLACLIFKSQMACFSNVSHGVTKRAAYITYSIDVSNRSSLTSILIFSNLCFSHDTPFHWPAYLLLQGWLFNFIKTK